MPPAEPIEELILQDVEAALKLISGDPNYFYTVVDKNVRRADKDGLTAASYPTIWVSPIGIESDQEPRETRVTTKNNKLMQIAVQAQIRTATSPSLECHRLQRDLEYALSVDRRRSELAIDSYLVTAEPWYPSAGSEPICGVDLIWEVRYRHTLLDPSTQG